MSTRDEAHLDAARSATREALNAFPAWCRAHALSCDAAALDRLRRYVDALIGWSARTSLVSRRELDRLVEKHVRPSVAPLLARSESDATPPTVEHVLDLGSGGGFPGVVLAALMPAWSVVLLEPTRRKRLFLDTLPAFLPNVLVRGERAEELNRVAVHRGRYDLVTVRAVSPPAIVWPLAAPLLAHGGEIHVYVPSHEYEAAAKAVRALRDAPDIRTRLDIPDHPGFLMRLAARGTD